MPFQADPSNVHFVATSATIGDEGATEDLRRYLADLAGVALDRVDVITGGRVTPELNTTGPDLELPPIQELANLESFEERQSRLASVPAIRELRHDLTRSPLNLAQVQQRIGFSFANRDVGDPRLLLGKTRGLKELDIAAVAWSFLHADSTWSLGLLESRVSR